jgi:Uma2 family endonuclease
MVNRIRKNSFLQEQEKMQECIENGAPLGWLIDPIAKQVHVYGPGQPVEVLNNLASVGSDPIVPGFVLPVHELW